MLCWCTVGCSCVCPVEFLWLVSIRLSTGMHGHNASNLWIQMGFSCLQEYQCNVHRWAFPTPTLWSEHRHIGAESRYVSKMDEFQAMVGDMKFNALTWTSTQALDNCSLEKRGDGSLTGCRQACVPKWAPPEDVKSCTISIINDFPHLHSPEARSQFCDHLMVLVQSARRPTILLVTDSGSYTK